MVRLWLFRGAKVVILAVGILAWGLLTLRATTTWVFSETKGLWFKRVADITPREVAIVPGCGFHGGRPNPGMEERLRLGLSLYRSGRVQAILVSGNDSPKGREVSEMRRWLLAHGVPPEGVLADPLGVRTLETMKRAASIFGIHSAVVCTQSWAAPRALFLARGAGIDALALVPQADRKTHSALVDRENMKIVLAFFERYFLRRSGGPAPQPGIVVTAPPPPSTVSALIDL